MYFIGLKIAIAIIILIIALLGGLLPIISRPQEGHKHWLTYGEVFSGGIFLGAGLIHLLPDAEQYMHLAHITYPLAFLVCAVTIWALYAIEEGALHFIYKPEESAQSWLAYLLIIMLSIHAVVVGAALGVEMAIAGLLVIFLAIISHKFAEAFALGVSMKKSKMPRKTAIGSMILFSCMTPAGIAMGSAIEPFLHGSRGDLTIGFFNAIAAGTFTYISVFHSIHSHLEPEEHDKISILTMLSCFAVGLALMAAVAIWL